MKVNYESIYLKILKEVRISDELDLKIESIELTPIEYEALKEELPGFSTTLDESKTILGIKLIVTT